MSDPGEEGPGSLSFAVPAAPSSPAWPGCSLFVRTARQGSSSCARCFAAFGNRPKVVAVVGHVSALAVAVKKTDALAESISAKVRQLDLQQVRPVCGEGSDGADGIA